MKELSLFNFGPHEVREMEKDGEPWFVAKDVIRVLDLGNITEALRGLQDDELSSVVLKSDIQNRELRLVSEPGLYRLVFRSRKPEAEKFKRWIAHEVLPSIRKQGVYLLEQENGELKDEALELHRDLRKARERYIKSHTPLNELERQSIRSGIRAGFSTKEIARSVGRSAHTVYRFRKELKESVGT